MALDVVALSQFLDQLLRSLYLRHSLYPYFLGWLACGAVGHDLKRGALVAIRIGLDNLEQSARSAALRYG